jgi:hypothetical protein
MQINRLVQYLTAHAGGEDDNNSNTSGSGRRRAGGILRDPQQVLQVFPEQPKVPMLRQARLSVQLCTMRHLQGKKLQMRIETHGRTKA